MNFSSKSDGKQSKGNSKLSIENYLKELPLTSLHEIPSSGHPNKGVWQGDDYTDIATIKHILNKTTKKFNHDCITAYYRGGGIESSYSVYRIKETTWRIIERSRYTD